MSIRPAPEAPTAPTTSPPWPRQEEAGSIATASSASLRGWLSYLVQVCSLLQLLHNNDLLECWRKGSNTKESKEGATKRSLFTYNLCFNEHIWSLPVSPTSRGGSPAASLSRTTSKMALSQSSHSIQTNARLNGQSASAGPLVVGGQPKLHSSGINQKLR